MILVRDIFQVKFGKMRDVLSLWAELGKIEQAAFGDVKLRVLTDLVGPYYTMVTEFEAESLAQFEEMLKAAFASDEWRAMYQKVIPLIDSGRREIFTIVQ